jgi:hypothetical protein
MLIKINNKWEAVHAVINTWLKDKRKYCNNCGKDYVPELGACCNDPAVMTNFDVCLGIIRQNRETQKSRSNDFASTKDGNLRWGVSLPPDLLRTLDGYMKSHGHKKGLFEEVSDLNKFMKKFPQFCVAKKV